MEGKKKTEEEENGASPKDLGEATSNGTNDVIHQVAQQQQSAEKKVVETKQVITFELDKEEYAAPILDPREILRIPEIIAVPGVPPFVKGIFNLRGQIVVVIDLEKRFALEREHPMEPRDVIIVEVGGTIFGVVVDEVTGVLRVPVTSIKPTPSFVSTKIHTDYLNGVIVLEELQGTEKKEELAPEQIEERLKTQKQTRSASSGQARLLLLLDLPKILSEEKLLGFGNHVRQVVEENK
ncbi:purine-binding chemotaxis protein CheW [Candidatus Falkowbacteria bacterium]|nr:purine-binding chemotaxis protein CheW [Candidatus Falkowbacteria bacterium]